MAFRRYIVRNRDNEAWLTHIYVEGGMKIYRFLPDAREAKVFDTLRDAQKVAEGCRGRVQVLKVGRDSVAYGEDVEK